MKCHAIYNYMSFLVLGNAIFILYQILVFNAINTIVTDMECNIRIDRLPFGQSAYPDIALHISNYYIKIAFPRN
jgi:hypothetical protein